MNKNSPIFSGIFLIFFNLSFSQNTSVAYSDDKVRFTVVTDGTVRLEYEPSGQFVDQPSFLASERTYLPVKYKVKKGSWIEIETNKIKLNIRKTRGLSTPLTSAFLRLKV